MDGTVKSYVDKNRNFTKKNSWLLYALAVILAVLWFFPLRTSINRDEERVWNKVREAENYLHQWRVSNEMETSAEYDPWKTSLIGLEWSPVTTTLGSLPSKRTACDPRWSVVTGRWLDRLGLEAGDRIAVYSSGSFPGLLLNVLCSAESRGLDVLLVVSLGASTWGGNVPGFTWPDIASLLRKEGFISTSSSFYTLGGGQENGGGLSSEGVEILERAALKAGVEILRTADLDEMIRRKVDLLESENVKVLVNIGGSSSSLGLDDGILSLPGGLIMPSDDMDPGNGVIAGALDRGIPVIHFLNLKGLSTMTGVPFDSRPGMHISKWRFPLISVVGIFLFLGVLLRFRRWAKDVA